MQTSPLQSPTLHLSAFSSLTHHGVLSVERAAESQGLHQFDRQRLMEIIRRPLTHPIFRSIYYPVPLAISTHSSSSSISPNNIRIMSTTRRPSRKQPAPPAVQGALHCHTCGRIMCKFFPPLSLLSISLPSSFVPKEKATHHRYLSRPPPLPWINI